MLLKIQFNGRLKALTNSVFTHLRLTSVVMCVLVYKLSRTGYKKLTYFCDGVSILGQLLFKTGSKFGVPGDTNPPNKYSTLATVSLSLSQSKAINTRLTKYYWSASVNLSFCGNSKVQLCFLLKTFNFVRFIHNVGVDGVNDGSKIKTYI